jgi:hypothetical protein
LAIQQEEEEEVYGDDEVAWYDTAQVCRNGHVITDEAASSPVERRAFCGRCGAGTVMSCEDCDAPIRGYYHAYMATAFPMTEPPAFCESCGSPYPWTSKGLEAARELAQELEGLDDVERIGLRDSLGDLVADTPRTELAALRVKKLLAKAGKGGADALRSILVSIATEAAKKSIGL